MKERVDGMVKYGDPCKEMTKDGQIAGEAEKRTPQFEGGTNQPQNGRDEGGHPKTRAAKARFTTKMVVARKKEPFSTVPTRNKGG